MITQASSEYSICIAVKSSDADKAKKYIDLYIGDKKEVNRIYEQVNDRWEISIALNPTSTFEQISFVNGIYTSKGGKHVDYIVDQIKDKLVQVIKKKKKT